MRPVLLGMNNPLSPHPRHALYPSPPGCTGWRLWQLLRRRVPGATEEQYLDAFERRNLLSAFEWSQSEAREAAVYFVRELTDSGRTVVVLGEATRRALGLDRSLILPQSVHGVTWRQLPHPSGRCRWYNDATCADLAALLLEELYRADC